MKNKPIFRWFLVGLVHLIMHILGIILFPIYYAFRKPIVKYKTPILWLFLNGDEKDYISNTYGDEGYRKRRGFDYHTASVFRKIWEAHIWLAWRNSHWNFRVHVLYPKQGELTNIDIIINDTTPETDGLTFCNYTIWGEQFTKYNVEDTRYFRYSFTRPTSKILQLVGLGKMWNVHSGWAPNRWILKCRWFQP